MSFRRLALKFNFGRVWGFLAWFSRLFINESDFTWDSHRFFSAITPENFESTWHVLGSRYQKSKDIPGFSTWRSIYGRVSLPELQNLGNRIHSTYVLKSQSMYYTLMLEIQSRMVFAPHRRGHQLFNLSWWNWFQMSRLLSINLQINSFSHWKNF